MDRTKGTKLTKLVLNLKSALCSVKIAVVVLIFICLLLIAGAVIPQGADHETYTELYGPFLANTLLISGLANVFGSWWFFLPIGYLVSAICISCVKGLKRNLKIIRKRQVFTQTADYESAPYHKSFVIRTGPQIQADSITQKIADILRKNNYPVVHSSCSEKVHYISASNGILGIFGPFLVHVSIITIVAGALWTATGRLSHSLEVGVGDSVAIGQTPYSVHLHDFQVQHYDKTTRPKEYVSLLSVTENGKILGKGELKVNAPLVLGGLHFYQMRYIPAVADVTITVQEKQDPRDIVEFVIPIGQRHSIDKAGLEIEPVIFLPDFALTSDKVAVSRTPDFINPAVLLNLYSDNKLIESKWIFAEPGSLHDATLGNYIYELKSFTPKIFSGIRVVRDRAIPLVYTGFLMLVAGTFLSCYMFHRQMWVMVKAFDEHFEVFTAANYSSNALDFQREIEKNLEGLS